MGIQRVALIAGVTGIVGNSVVAKLLQEPKAPESSSWKVYGVARRSAKPDWLPESLLYIGCNLLDREEMLSKMSRLQDVTHLCYVTWVNRLTEEENIKTNTQLYRNILDALLPNANNFQHIVLQTGTKHYLGPFELAGQVPVSDPPFREDYPRHPCANFYHDLEDMTFETVKGTSITYSIHRPTGLFGFAESNLMNMVSTLAVYAAICHYQNKPLIFPGSKMRWDSCRCIRCGLGSRTGDLGMLRSQGKITVEFKLSIPIDAIVEISLKGFTLGNKAEKDFFFFFLIYHFMALI